MIRKKLFGSLHHDHFRHRGTEILRIEALSDAVFAFSVSLLVASLEAPQTFRELQNIIRGAIPFFATVALVFLFWYQQYVFFRHYALNDAKTIVLNLLYLAVILFYVYPLKFLFSLLISSWTGLNLFPGAPEGEEVLLIKDFPSVVILFSSGYFLIWILLYFMYRHALHLKKEMNLNQYEIAYTIKEKQGSLSNAAIGIIAIILSFTDILWLPGVCYLLIPVVTWLNKKALKRRIKKLTV